MTEDLKTKIAEAIHASDHSGPEFSPYRAESWCLASNQELYGKRAQAALQAIHDEGYVVIHNTYGGRFSRNEAYADKVRAHVKWKTDDGATIDPIWAVLLAIGKAEALPKTGGE